MQAGGRGFDSFSFHFLFQESGINKDEECGLKTIDWRLAQLVERSLRWGEAVGSNPSSSIFYVSLDGQKCEILKFENPANMKTCNLQDLLFFNFCEIHEFENEN